tara:strand:+ start:159 stop:431 length:273 start_codon:yes stop_codon:yes gene_type:complete
LGLLLGFLFGLLLGCADEDFIKDPEGDIQKATKQWHAWGFSGRSEEGYKGPMNDACLQDYTAWMNDDPTNPIGHLIPDNCVTGGLLNYKY